MNLLNEFPITGLAVCNRLSTTFQPIDNCVITDIETLCSKNCDRLGMLWEMVVSTRKVIFTIAELLPILACADQVISLNIYDEKETCRYLIIEDGILLEDTL